MQWLSAVFSHPDFMGALVIAGKTAVIYVAIILGLRLLGKRELGQMSVYDLVLIIIIANSVQNAMVGSDVTLLGGLTAAVTLLLLNWAITWVMNRKASIRKWMEGQPVLIVRNGVFLKEAMKREGVTKEHIMAAMREHELDDPDKVQMAVLEVDGTISIVPKESNIYKTHRIYRKLRI